jgi:hypothetical protein
MVPGCPNKLLFHNFNFANFHKLYGLHFIIEKMSLTTGNRTVFNQKCVEVKSY